MVRNILFLILSPFFFLISLCFPKNKKRWCLGAWFGKKYADNSKYLFEFISETEQDHGITSVWITEDEAIIKSIRGKGYRSYHKYSLSGLWYQFTSEVFICSVNSKDFYFATLSPRNTIIQLYHGAPLKKIGFDSETNQLHKLWSAIRAVIIDKYSFILSPSKIFDPLFCSAFSVDQSKILRGGFPRNDGLFLNCSTKAKIRSWLGANEDTTLLLYLPTHRGEGKNSVVVKEMLDQFLASDDVISDQKLMIVAKPHFYDLSGISMENQGKAVKVLKDFGEWDLYQVLGAADGLITDYSSVFFDYEILNKPVYFLAPDLEWYVNQDRGMYFKYSSFAHEYCQDVKCLLGSMNTGRTHLTKGIVINEDKSGEYCRKIFDKLLAVVQV